MIRGVLAMGQRTALVMLLVAPAVLTQSGHTSASTRAVGATAASTSSAPFKLQADTLESGSSALHNGGFQEVLQEPATGRRPHVLFILVDDFGWADAGWHRPKGYADVQTPVMESLLAEGIELDRHYVYKYCSPSRSAIQSGRNPIHVNTVNTNPGIANPLDPVGGFAGIPRNMTGIATKLSAAGYSTAMFGKWDAGMATYDHTPKGRGYMYAMNYFNHDNDYWTSYYTDQAHACNGTLYFHDLWLADGTGYEGPARDFVSKCPLTAYDQQNDSFTPDFVLGRGCVPGAEGDSEFNGFEDALFEEQVLRFISHHDAASPFFVFWAMHAIHTPLQIPREFYEKFSFMAPTDNQHTHSRQIYHALVNFADTAIGNVTAAIRTQALWENTLIILTTDNGGPIYENGTAGANNHPLKGGKMSNWEGGIRGNAFLSGGFLPKKVRGTKYEGLICGWDWYATLCHLAGVSDHDQRAAAAHLPPIDSLSMVPVIMGTGASPRKQIALGTEPRHGSLWGPGVGTSVNGMIEQDEGGKLWKLLTGPIWEAGWTGATFPNRSTNTRCFDHPKSPATPPGACIQDCANGTCLFELTTDPNEHSNLAHDTSMRTRIDAMVARLRAAEATSYTPKRCTCPDGFGGTGCAYFTDGTPYERCPDHRSCSAALLRGGFWGPFIK